MRFQFILRFAVIPTTVLAAAHFRGRVAHVDASDDDVRSLKRTDRDKYEWEMLGEELTGKGNKTEKRSCGVPHCTYINLDRRTDRQKNLETQLSEAQLSCSRMSAVDAEAEGIPAVKACRESHIKALELLLQSSAPYGLILEDDAVWTQDMDMVREYLCHIEDHMKDHPVFLLSCNPDGHGWGCPSKFSWMRHPDRCQQSEAYVVRRDYAHVLLEQWTYSADEAAIDQTWKPLQKKDRWAMTWPLLMRQGASNSDIEKSFVDYGDPEEKYQGASACDGHEDDQDQATDESSSSGNSDYLDSLK
jgi:hypothetical protein